jgi:hypothetical protein
MCLIKKNRSFSCFRPLKEYTTPPWERDILYLSHFATFSCPKVSLFQEKIVLCFVTFLSTFTHTKRSCNFLLRLCRSGSDKMSSWKRIEVYGINFSAVITVFILSYFLFFSLIQYTRNYSHKI